MKILLLGANGQVGWELQRSLCSIGQVMACGRDQADLENHPQLRDLIRSHRPDVIVNAAAYTAVDQAEEEQSLARVINADAVSLLAEEARNQDAWLIHYSTDYVFSGRKEGPYRESDSPDPINVYGQTKWQGEESIRAQGCRHLIFRTGWVYASRGRNFLRTMLRLAADQERMSVVDDQWGAPTHAAMIADVTALALHRCLTHPNCEHLSGTYHLVAGGETNWHDYACAIVELAGQLGFAMKMKAQSISAVSSDEYRTVAKRPKNSRLNCEKLEQAFKLELADWRQHLRLTLCELAEMGRSR